MNMLCPLEAVCCLVVKKKKQKSSQMDKTCKVYIVNNDKMKDYSKDGLLRLSEVSSGVPSHLLICPHTGGNLYHGVNDL